MRDLAQLVDIDKVFTRAIELDGLAEMLTRRYPEDKDIQNLFRWTGATVSLITVYRSKWVRDA